MSMEQTKVPRKGEVGPRTPRACLSLDGGGDRFSNRRVQLTREAAAVRVARVKSLGLGATAGHVADRRACPCAPRTDAAGRLESARLPA